MSINDSNKLLTEFLQLDENLFLDNKFDNPILKDEGSKIINIFLTTNIKETSCK